MTHSMMYGVARPLVDADYRRIGSDLITPFNSAHVQPASYDVTLGPKILRPREELEVFPRPYGAPRSTLDLRHTNPAEFVAEHEVGAHYVLPSCSHALVSTLEQVRCPPDMIASVDGKSTLGRCFLAIHVTAGFIDPGFVGKVTLELVNHGPWDFVLYEGMRIGQLRFHWLAINCERPYGTPGLGSHYQGSLDVRPAAMQEDEL